MRNWVSGRLRGWYAAAGRGVLAGVGDVISWQSVRDEFLCHKLLRPIGWALINVFQLIRGLIDS